MWKLLVPAILVIFCFQCSTAETQWNDLRLTFGLSPVGFFNRVPRTIRDPMFAQQNWTIVSTNCENNGTFHGYQAVVPGDYGIALLYDRNGIIAGIQQLLNKTSMLAPENNVNYPMLPVYQSQTFENQDYFLITVYFVPPSIICSTGRNETDLANEGTGTQIFIQNGTNPQAGLVEIPRNRSVAIEQGWPRNQCFPGMGQHNFHAVDKYQNHNCTEVFPFFGLYTAEGELLGFGFAHAGTAENHRFEHPSAQVISLIIGPEQTPQCIIDKQQRIGLTSSHVYFIDEPWLLGC